MRKSLLDDDHQETMSGFEEHHDGHPSSAAGDSDIGKLKKAAALVLVFMLVEFIGGILSGSLAVLSDAAHMMSDLLSFLLSIAAITLSKKPAGGLYTFGHGRAEVLGAMASVLIIWVLTVMLVVEAVERCQAYTGPDSDKYPGMCVCPCSAAGWDVWMLFLKRSRVLT